MKFGRRAIKFLRFISFNKSRNMKKKQIYEIHTIDASA